MPIAYTHRQNEYLIAMFYLLFYFYLHIDGQVRRWGYNLILQEELNQLIRIL
jgi:hypothetical protein